MYGFIIYGIQMHVDADVHTSNQARMHAHIKHAQEKRPGG